MELTGATVQPGGGYPVASQSAVAGRHHSNGRNDDVAVGVIAEILARSRGQELSQGGDGEQTRHYPDGSSYEGEFREGMRHGVGTYVWPDGDTFHGCWRENQQEGHGTYTWAVGGAYEGEFRNDKRQGKGVYVSADGDRYDGTYHDGKKHGHGEYTWAKGHRYKGPWKDDYMHSEGSLGTFISQDGWSYKGQLALNRPTNGVLTDEDNRRFSVTFSPDCAPFPDCPRALTKDEVITWTTPPVTGQQTYSYTCHGENKDHHYTVYSATGKTYTGQWLDGKRHGHGKLVWADGDSFEGAWRAPIPAKAGEGLSQGALVELTGTNDPAVNGMVGELGDYVLATNRWKVQLLGGGKGSLPSSISLAPVNIRLASLSHGEMHGKGTSTWADGSSFSGEWRGGKKHGSGCFSFPEHGTSFQGVWRNGLLESGKYVFARDNAPLYSSLRNATAVPDFIRISGATEPDGTQAKVNGLYEQHKMKVGDDIMSNREEALNKAQEHLDATTIAVSKAKAAARASGGPDPALVEAQQQMAKAKLRVAAVKSARNALFAKVGDANMAMWCGGDHKWYAGDTEDVGNSFGCLTHVLASMMPSPHLVEGGWKYWHRDRFVIQNGTTPADLAEQRGYTEAMRGLREFGNDLSAKTTVSTITVVAVTQKELEDERKAKEPQKVRLRKGRSPST